MLYEPRQGLIPSVKILPRCGGNGATFAGRGCASLLIPATSHAAPRSRTHRSIVLFATLYHRVSFATTLCGVKFGLERKLPHDIRASVIDERLAFDCADEAVAAVVPKDQLGIGW